jgi:hypothetical protein
MAWARRSGPMRRDPPPALRATSPRGGGSSTAQMLPLWGSCREATEGVFHGHGSSTSALRGRVGGEARSGPGPARMTVGLECAFRLDLTAPRNRLSQGTTTEGLFHPGRRFPSGGQDQVARKGPSATPTDPGTGRFELPAPSTRLSRHRPHQALEPSEPRRPPRSDRQAQAAPLGPTPIACLGRYQEPSPAIGTASIVQEV